MKKLDRRTGYCNCEETKDEFGGCVPNKKGTRCIACGFRINKGTMKNTEIEEAIKHIEKNCNIKDEHGKYMKTALTALRSFRDNGRGLGEEEINLALKSVSFKDFIPVNGVRGIDETRVTLHNNARKRYAKAIVKMQKEKV